MSSLRRTPFTDHHERAGARMVPFAGFSMPVQYTGLIEEHLRVRESLGLFDVSHMGEVLVRGPRALDAVQHLVTNDVASLVDGQAQYNCICNTAGGVVDDTIVYRLSGDTFMLCVNAANRDKDFAWLTSHSPHPDDARMTDVGDAWAQIAVQGRAARDTLAALPDLDLDAIGTYHFAPEATVAGISGCMVARTGYTGEDGFEVYAPAESAEPLWPALLEAGAPHGVLPIGLGARDTLRLEARYCLYGHELTDETSPLQAGLGWVTKLKKGPFVGRDALCRRKGHEPRRLAGLVVEGRRIPREGMDVRVGDTVVGRTTSGTRSPSLGTGIALAYLDVAHHRPGTEVVIDVRGRPAPARVIRGPFYTRPY